MRFESHTGFELSPIRATNPLLPKNKRLTAGGEVPSAGILRPPGQLLGNFGLIADTTSRPARGSALIHERTRHHRRVP